MKDADARQKMREIAEDYESLAERLEHHSRNANRVIAHQAGAGRPRAVTFLLCREPDARSGVGGGRAGNTQRAPPTPSPTLPAGQESGPA